MDDQHLKDLNPDGVSDAVRCLICLNTFSGQPVASPQHCDHFYCLSCISEWTKVTNSCPVDRVKFTVLYQRSCAGRGIQNIITVVPHDVHGLEEDERFEELSVCEECGRSDRRHQMLLCSACDIGFHISCLSPPLATVPFEDWFCLECASEHRQTCDSFSVEENEITEAEMMDLLSEVVPTSSRLRPSTSTQCAGSVQTRRSERLQLNSRTCTTLSQTVQHVPRYLLKSTRSNIEEATTRNLILNTRETDMVTYKKKKKTENRH